MPDIASVTVSEDNGYLTFQIALANRPSGPAAPDVFFLGFPDLKEGPAFDSGSSVCYWTADVLTLPPPSTIDCHGGPNVMVFRLSEFDANGGLWMGSSRTFSFDVKSYDPADSSWDFAPDTGTWQYTLPPLLQGLAVNKDGSGDGMVTSSPSGISCGSACSANFADGTSVTLTATPTGGSTFAGWSGDCSGTGTCALTLDGTHLVTATFNRECVVPRVVGKTLTAALAVINRASCAVGRVTHAASSKPKGTVISQKPGPGATLPNKSKIDLVVSRGKN